MRIVFDLRSWLSLPRAEIEAGWPRKLGPLLEEPPPRGAGDPIGLGHERGLVHGQHATVAHDPSAVDHDRLDVAGEALVHEARDHAQRGREVSLSQVDQDPVGAIAGREPAAVGDTRAR
jgi:hypothetical protein